jgi:acyl-coenzyme A synthetase/AMP-(fatty) acid ligase
MLISDGDIFGIPPALANSITLREGCLHLHRRLMEEFKGPWIDGEWYNTGDLIEMVDTDPARFRFVGWKDGWVNVGGYKVNPLEVESRLEAHPAVVAARVFGRRNSVSGQILCAEVVARDLALVEADLRVYLGAHLQAAKIPRVIRFVERIEGTRSGKRLRS